VLQVGSYYTDSLSDFKLPPPCRGDLRCSGILHNVEWKLHADVSGQPVGPIFKSKPSWTSDPWR